ncbi:hypothetical protein ACIBBE_42785 [Streptomyces sp. NPDC051644]|uniref:hypothetical protein n=1 Tax=Streptomyces sp. NPDC051644 TaxID=3365666 RepID=UPI0037B8A5F4
MSTQESTKDKAKKPDRRRITADLPDSEFEVLEDARILQGASTTDIARALLRLYSADPDLAQRVSGEIATMRQEKLQARHLHGQIWRRRRGATSTQTGKELSAA